MPCDARSGRATLSAVSSSSSSRRERAVCWGEVLWDLFPEGRQLGGAPSNVAYHLAALGAEVTLVSRVGADDAGRDALAALGDAGVDVAGVQVDAERPTGAVDIQLEAGEPRYRLRPGCAWERIACDAAAEACLRDAGALVFGTLSQRCADGRAGWRAAIAAAAEDCLLVCDPNLRPGHLDRDVVLEALAASDVVKINEQEAAAIAQELGLSDPVSWLLERGASLVALTRGAAGCSLFAGGRRVDRAGFPARPGGDNVGAGDAFTAALVSGLLRRDTLEAIAERACRYGAHVASERGATPPPPPWLGDR